MAKGAKKSELELHLETRMIQTGLSGFEKQYKAVPGRKWAWDFAFPAAKLLIEVNGGTFIKGGHSTGLGIRRDYEKLNAATVNGWRCLIFDGKMVRDDTASAVIAEAILAGTEPAKE